MLRFCSALFLWIVFFLPFILFVSLPCTILKFLHILIAKFVAPELIPIWKWQDSIFAIYPSSSKAVVTCNIIYKLDGILNLEDFRSHFKSAFFSSPAQIEKNVNFLCYFERFGLYIFKRRVNFEDLDLNSHIFEGPKGLRSEADVQAFASKFVSEDDRTDTPAWEAVIVYLKEKNESYVILKMHHALLDGYTFVKITQKLSGVPQPYVPEAKDSWALVAKSIFYFPITLISIGFRQGTEGSSPFKNGSENAAENPWFVSWAPLPLSKVKLARKELGNVKFKTVLVAAQISALRKYYLENCGGKESELPEATWIPTPYPVPLHPAMLQDEMCNHFTFNYYRVPFRSVPYLQITSESESSFTELEQDGMPQVWDYVLGPLFLWNCPQPLFAWGMAISNKFGILTQEQCLSANMLSPQKLSILGLPCPNVYATVVLSSLYASTHFNLISASNGDNVNVIVSASKKIFKSQEDLNHFVTFSLSKELDEIIEHAASGKEKWQ